jgi:pSer/pThr/pTyr-binding forkhead associated (FHA) protein
MQLTVRSGADAGASVTVDRRLTIGREGDFRLTDPTISRMHAAVTPTSDGRVLLEDLGSTGGTVVNGTRLFGPVTLRGGEQILMGGSILEVSATPPTPAAGVGGGLPAAPSVPPPPPPPPPPLGPVPRGSPGT